MKDWRNGSKNRQYKKDVRLLSGGKCFATDEPIKRKNTEIHHIWDASTYPLLRTWKYNGVVLATHVHKKYHSWNGGTRKPCTWFGFHLFLLLHYPRKSAYFIPFLLLTSILIFLGIYNLS